MKRVSYIIFAVSLLILILSIVSYAVNRVPLQTKTIYASVNLSDSLGLDINESVLTFGSVAPGSTVSRNVLFSNDYNFPVIVEIKALGIISPLMEFENFVKIGSLEQKKISFTLSSREYPSGDYDGFVEFNVFHA